MSRLLLIAGCCLVTLSAAAKEEPLEREVRSPDRKLRAVVHTEGEGHSESIVEIWRGTGARIYRWNGTSPDETHGWVVQKAAWTTDSRFFVFSVASSGGHSPWHSPTYAYRRGTNTLLALDDAAGPITSSSFRLEKGDVVRTRVKQGENLEGKPTVIRLLSLKAAGKKSD